MKKIAVFLAVVLLLATVLPAEALAASKTAGRYGALSWKLDDKGTLTISGKGDMPGKLEKVGGVKQYHYPPWYDHAGKIKKVVIKKGVTSIGMLAFAEFTKLTSVTIPEGVVSIDDLAFD